MVSPELLRRYPYFSAGGEAALKRIAMMAQETAIGEGETLFEEGQPAKDLYVITEGEVDIQLRLQGDNRVVVETCVAGALVGWSGMSAPGRRRASCIARRACKLVRIDGSGLRDLCDSNAELGYRLMCEVVRALTQRLDGAWAQLAVVGDAR